MKINKTIATAILLFGLLADACREENEANKADTDNVQEEREDQADDATEANEAEETNGVDEADEAATLQGQAGITANEAQAAVEAVNPGVKTLAVELDNENGSAIYEVELDNGQDVKVDATNGVFFSILLIVSFLLDR